MGVGATGVTNNMEYDMTGSVLYGVGRVHKKRRDGHVNDTTQGLCIALDVLRVFGFGEFWSSLFVVKRYVRVRICRQDIPSKRKNTYHLL